MPLHGRIQEGTAVALALRPRVVSLHRPLETMRYLRLPALKFELSPFDKLGV